MSTLFVLDIDGTLADASRRFKEAGTEPCRSNKEKYTSWVRRVQNAESLLADPVVPGMAVFAQALAAKAHVVYLTAREEQWRDVTTEWLIKHGFPMVPLHMRQPDDWDNSGEYKAKLLQRWKHGYQNIVMTDDDPQGDIEEECKSLGVTFLKARSGGY